MIWFLTFLFRKSEIFVLNETIEQYTSFDECLLAAQHFNEELYSLAELVRGQSQSPPKKAKTTDVRPLVFVRFNSRMG